METKKINLFVFDSKENYEKSKKFLGEAHSTFKEMICIDTLTEFEKHFNEIDEEDHVYLVVHVFWVNKISGILRYITSGIAEKYPKLGQMYISEGDERDIKHMMVNQDLDTEPIYKYHQVYSNLRDGVKKVYTKKQILECASSPCNTLPSTVKHSQANLYPQIDYAIITALYENEFEELMNVFSFPEEKQIKAGKKVYHRGYLKTDKSIEIVATTANATGMVDAAILATQIVEFFKPKYLLMPGVCGGAISLNVGDIVVAKQIYTFQKGKLSDLKRKDKSGQLVKVNVYDKNKKNVNYEQLYDNNGNKVSMSIEKFEIEHDAMITIDSALEDSIKSKLESIRFKINQAINTSGFYSTPKMINIEIGPIACSTMVIDKDGYFEDFIKSINRKTIALEMESYGIARACQFANEGKTIPIIFKSVMDNTFNKKDNVNGFNVKKFAAHTSALFLKYLFEEKVI